MSAVREETPPFEDDDDYEVPEPTPLIPKFEGREVRSTNLKFAGALQLDDDPNLVVGVDDRIRIVCVARVTDVRHFVDKDGNLIREHKAKIIEVARTPFDPANPHDQGVLRA